MTGLFCLSRYGEAEVYMFVPACPVKSDSSQRESSFIQFQSRYDAAAARVGDCCASNGGLLFFEECGINFRPYQLIVQQGHKSRKAYE